MKTLKNIFQKEEPLQKLNNKSLGDKKPHQKKILRYMALETNVFVARPQKQKPGNSPGEFFAVVKTHKFSKMHDFTVKIRSESDKTT